MMTSKTFSRFLQTNIKFLLGAVTIAASTFIYTALAAPPGSPYNLGETLAPTCAPGDINCTVDTPQEGNAYLTDIADITADQGDIIYFNGTDWVDLAPGTSGHYLQTLGVGANPQWAVGGGGSGDFSNGGEAGGADRTLGNTDNFDLSFLTNNLNRLHIQNDGNVGIGTTTPDTKLHILGATGEHGHVRITGSEGNSAMLDLWADEGDDSADKWRINSNGSGLYFEDTYSSKYLAIEYNTGVVINEAGENDVDFRVESDTDTHAFFVDATNGNVGIGTTNPSERLEVSGNINVNTGKIYISPIDAWENPLVVYESAGGDAAVSVQVNGNSENSLNIKNNNVNAVKISGNGNTYLNGGNVGIGTTSPSSILYVEQNHDAVSDITLTNNNSGVNAMTRILFKNDISGGGVGIVSSNSSVTSYANRMLCIAEENSSGLLFGAQDTTGDIVFHTGGINERMRIDSDGYVGIGTATPGTTLELASGQIYMPDGINSAPSYSFSSDTDTGMYLSSTDLIFTADGSNILKLDESSDANRNSLYLYSPNNTKNVQIYCDQLWNVGTIHTNAAKLELWADGWKQIDISNTVIDAQDNDIVTTGNVGIGTDSPSIDLAIGDTDTGLQQVSDDVLAIYTNNAERIRIDTSGLVGIGRSPATNDLEIEGIASKTSSGDWLANSDRRIKTDVQNIENALDTILRLRPVKFKYTDEYKQLHPCVEDKYYYNFIAQEYQEIFPGSVKGSGEYLDGDEDEILQMDSYNAQVVAIKAIQELKIQLDEKDSEIELLKFELCAKDNSYSWCVE